MLIVLKPDTSILSSSVVVLYAASVSPEASVTARSAISRGSAVCQDLSGHGSVESVKSFRGSLRQQQGLQCPPGHFVAELEVGRL